MKAGQLLGANCCALSSDIYASLFGIAGSLILERVVTLLYFRQTWEQRNAH